MSRTIDASVYRRAERLDWSYRQGLVPGGQVRPRWIDGGKKFWYVRRVADERETILVDPVAGTREVVTDPGVPEQDGDRGRQSPGGEVARQEACGLSPWA
jgi:hypothetical protein